MNIYLLDIPGGDRWLQQRRERQNQERQQIQQLEQAVTENERALQAREARLLEREAMIRYKEEALQKYAPKEWKKILQKREQRKQQGVTGWNQNDENIINLSHAVSGTTAHIAANTPSLPANDDNPVSSGGSLMMICSALFLCVTSGLIYRKKQK